MMTIMLTRSNTNDRAKEADGDAMTTIPTSLMTFDNFKNDDSDNFMITAVIKTITKFSNVIGYQQPDLSINWTPSARVMLVVGQYASFCARSVLWSTLLSKLLGFQHS